MNPETNIVVNAIAWMVVIGGFFNVVFFLANLKLYTEIMQEKSQRERKRGETKP